MINNSNREKPNKNLGEKKIGFGGVIPTLNMFMIFMNRKTLSSYKQTETKQFQGKACLSL